MATTGNIYDPISGQHIARIENDTDVIDSTTRDGGNGDGIPAPDAFKALLSG